MVRPKAARYYTRVSRHASSAFLRLKLGRSLDQSVAPHMFETREEAQALLVGVAE
jgi:propionate CoA-transferase